MAAKIASVPGPSPQLMSTATSLFSVMWMPATERPEPRAQRVGQFPSPGEQFQADLSQCVVFLLGEYPDRSYVAHWMRLTV